MKSSNPWWRKRSVLAAAAVAAAIGLSALLGGPAPGDLVELLSADRVASTGAPAPPAAGEGTDSAAGPGAEASAATPDSPAGADTALAAGPGGEGTASGDTAVGAGSASGVAGGEASPEEESGESATSGAGGPAEDGDESLPTIPGPREGAGELPAVNADVASFEAVSDSLARTVEIYYRRAERLNDGAGSCGPVVRARDRADRLFERLWLYHMSLQAEMDSPGRAEYRTRSRQMEDVQRSFLLTDCSGRGSAASGG